MKRSPHRLKHEQKKAIRQAQREAVDKKEPGELNKKQKKTYLSSPRKVKISKAKVTSKHKHHMTSPNEVTFQTEPENIHQEGEYWIRKVQRKTLNATNHFQKKLQKLNFLRKKNNLEVFCLIL